MAYSRRLRRDRRPSREGSDANRFVPLTSGTRPATGRRRLVRRAVGPPGPTEGHIDDEPRHAPGVDGAPRHPRHADDPGNDHRLRRPHRPVGNGADDQAGLLLVQHPLRTALRGPGHRRGARHGACRSARRPGPSHPPPGRERRRLVTGHALDRCGDELLDAARLADGAGGGRGHRRPRVSLARRRRRRTAAPRGLPRPRRERAVPRLCSRRVRRRRRRDAARLALGILAAGAARAAAGAAAAARARPRASTGPWRGRRALDGRRVRLPDRSPNALARAARRDGGQRLPRGGQRLRGHLRRRPVPRGYRRRRPRPARPGRRSAGRGVDRWRGEPRPAPRRSSGPAAAADRGRLRRHVTAVAAGAAHQFAPAHPAFPGRRLVRSGLSAAGAGRGTGRGAPVAGARAGRVGPDADAHRRRGRRPRWR